MGTLFDHSQTQLRRFQEAGFDLQAVWECKIRQNDEKQHRWYKRLDGKRK